LADHFDWPFISLLSDEITTKTSNLEQQKQIQQQQPPQDDVLLIVLADETSILLMTHSHRVYSSPTVGWSS